VKYKNDWFQKGAEFRSRRDFEKSELLKEHYEIWAIRESELHAECEEDGGHDFRNLPDNGMNHPSYGTNEWPQACSKCRMRKPR